MSNYSQELRVFVISCPSGTPIAQKLMNKISEAANNYDILEQQRDALLGACKIAEKALVIRNEDEMLQAQCTCTAAISQVNISPNASKVSEESTAKG